VNISPDHQIAEYARHFVGRILSNVR
jgi:hypothetical protein